MTNTCPRVSI